MGLLLSPQGIESCIFDHLTIASFARVSSTCRWVLAVTKPYRSAYAFAVTRPRLCDQDMSLQSWRELWESCVVIAKACGLSQKVLAHVLRSTLTCVVDDGRDPRQYHGTQVSLGKINLLANLLWKRLIEGHNLHCVDESNHKAALPVELCEPMAILAMDAHGERSCRGRTLNFASILLLTDGRVVLFFSLLILSNIDDDGDCCAWGYVSDSLIDLHKFAQDRFGRPLWSLHDRHGNTRVAWFGREQEVSECGCDLMYGSDFVGTDAQELEEDMAAELLTAFRTFCPREMFDQQYLKQVADDMFYQEALLAAVL